MKYLPVWTPFATFHNIGQHGRRLVAELIQKPFDHVKAGLVRIFLLDSAIHVYNLLFQAEGTAKPSFTAHILADESLKSERIDISDFEGSLKWAAASMYAGT